MAKKKAYIYILAAVTWVSIVASGFIVLMNDDSTPGKTIPILSHWPSQSPLQHDTNKPTLVMFVHPQCPCTRASVSELTGLEDKFGNKIKTDVIFFQPIDASDNWLKTDTWSKVHQIPGVSVFQDKDGLEARYFHATVSGQVFFYDPKGRLLSNGGITPFRGEKGDNDGEKALEGLIAHHLAKRSQTPVFGCPLFRSLNALLQKV